MAAKLREYEPLFSDVTVAFLLHLPKRRQTWLVERCREIARDPFVIADRETIDAAGHRVAHLELGDYLVSYWVDHPAHQVLFLEIDSLA